MSDTEAITTDRVGLNRYIGQRITHYRKRRCLSQGDLSRRLGLNQSTVSRWENGKDGPSVASVMSLAKALNVAAADLLPEGGA